MEGLRKNLRGRPGSVHRRQQLQCQAIGSVGRGSRHPPGCQSSAVSSLFYKKELLDYCKSKNIALEAYSPLARGRKLNDPVIAKIAGKYAKAPAQIMIRWSLQHGLIPIPKSSNKKRIFENAKVFDFHIENDDMKVLDNLS